MITPFPELLTYAIVAPFVLRLFAGLYFLYSGYVNLSRERRQTSATLLRVEWGTLGTLAIWYLGFFEILVGLSLLFGYLTQIGALIGLFVVIKLYSLSNRYPHLAKESDMFYILLSFVCLSLLFSGAGAFAMDLPL